MGLVSFYTYTPEGYREALDSFARINPPKIEYSKEISSEAKSAYALYLLSQANIAITKAHQMIGNESSAKQRLPPKFAV